MAVRAAITMTIWLDGRMDAIQAAVLRVKMTHIASWNERRRHHAATYDQLFAESGLLAAQKSNGCAPVRLLARNLKAQTCLPSIRDSRPAPRRLAYVPGRKKISTEIYYPLPLHLQPVFSYLGFKAGDLPVAEHAAQEVLALPMFPELSEAEIRSVVEGIKDFYS